MPRLLSAIAAERSTDKANEERKLEYATFLKKEEKFKRLQVTNLPDLIEKKWLPRIRSAAKIGRYSWEFQVLSDEEGEAACQLLKKLGFHAHVVCGSSHSLKDRGVILSAVAVDW
ncbi:hypothetical protein KJ836_00720 [Patescibacteria group bacterium]|nr:hypothetical protein [Patescibacteria group bacterium]